MPQTRFSEFSRRALTVILMTVGVIVLLLGFWYAAQVFLFAFAGILIAIVLGDLAARLEQRTRLPHGAALGLVILLIVGALAVFIAFISPAVSGQIDVLIDYVPRAARSLPDRLAQYAWGRALLQIIPPVEDLGRYAATMFSGATNFLSGFINAVLNLFLLFCVGVYLAIEPQLYFDNFLRLIPLAKRDRVRATLIEVNDKLRGWLFGQFISMLAIGVMTTIGLWLLGVPLALTLGLIAGLLTFIPNLGPLIALIPAALIALQSGVRMSLYVVALYLVVQTLETYLITPYVQRQAIALPAALIIMTQVLFGFLFGFLGLLLATPLTAALIVIVHRLYVEDVLEDRQVFETSSGD